MKITKTARLNYKKLYKEKCIVLNQKIEELKYVLQKNKEYQNKIKTLEKTNISKGSLCSVYGKKYEKHIHSIINQCYIDGKKILLENEKNLGGCSTRNDITCNYKNNIVGIEIKKYNTPDWMQCSIKYDAIKNQWKSSEKSKISKKARDIFEELINNITIFKGQLPPFLEKQLTYNEWIEIKKNNDAWNDQYIDIPNDIIRKLYTIKNCQYIQISDGYGLYHLGNDICNFNVPLFDIKQQLRIRIKVHATNSKKGFCVLSITLACQPKNIKLIETSKYSLDDKNKLPKNLIYHND